MEQLQNPDNKILAQGGAILFAKDENEIVGTVGLVKVSEGIYEMIKMGVLPKAQGKKIGKLLATSILEKAKQMGGSKVILYSNSKQQTALVLYRKLGFRETTSECGKYQRCDVKMEIDL